MIKKQLEPADIVAIIDTREQRPLDLSPLRVERGTLACGDYSVAGLTHVISWERKSIDDMAQVCARDRPRFLRELQRMLAYPVRGVIVEATWQDILAGRYRSKISPASVAGSILSWMGEGIPFFFAANPQEAGKAMARLLFLAARRRYRELQSFSGALDMVSSSDADAAVRCEGGNNVA